MEITSKGERHQEIIKKLSSLEKRIDDLENKLSELLELMREEAKSKPREWLEPKEAMKYLKIGRTTLYRLMKDGTLRYHKFSKGKYADIRFTYDLLNEALGEPIQGILEDDLEKVGDDKDES